jgi:PhnB protein
MASKKTSSQAKKPAAAPAKKAAAKAKPAAKKAKSKRKVAAIPKGFRSLTPYLIVRNAAAALGFYAKAFGAKETLRMHGPGDSIMHAEIRIGDSMLMISEENPDWGSKSPLTLGGNATHVMIYSKDADAFVAKAVAAGCTVEMPVTPMFWGDRYGKISDPYGHQWSIATHVEDVGPKEMKRRAEAWQKQMMEGG